MKSKRFSRLALAGIAAGSLVTHAHAAEPYCREYTRNVTIGGHVQEGYGTACQQPDGTWEIVSSNLEPAAEEVPMVHYVGRERPVYVQTRHVVPTFPVVRVTYNRPYYSKCRHQDRFHRGHWEHRGHRGHGHRYY